MVADVLSRKNMGDLANLLVERKELRIELNKMNMDLVVREQEAILAVVGAQPTLLEEIKLHQLEDETLRKIYEELEVKPKSGFSYVNSVLKFQSRICVPNMLELKRKLLEEAHASRLSIHPGNPSHVIDHHQLMLDDKLSYEERPLRILERQVKQLRNREISMVKVEWQEHYGTEATWEKEEDMQQQYPYLFPF
ncbi:uncharacterized protein LOC114321900 [Camellia sinensis]|uniref:uncharacterized protein LOC114321900 n=1 Tax=Camellia sinensis TaxID=4442 RepID=UPI00103643E7|nr:uncharacterized protein LOC114321900 [Camellia sinensis]